MGRIYEHEIHFHVNECIWEYLAARLLLQNILFSSRFFFLFCGLVAGATWYSLDVHCCFSNCLFLLFFKFTVHVRRGVNYFYGLKNKNWIDSPLHVNNTMQLLSYLCLEYISAKFPRHRTPMPRCCCLIFPVSPLAFRSFYKSVESRLVILVENC